MKLAPDLAPLEAARTAMGAALSTWRIGVVPLPPPDPIDVELEKGRDLPLDDVRAGPGGLLTVEGRQVVLYIRAARKERETLLNEPQKANRYHVADCTALQEMRRRNRFERYVATTRVDGRFVCDAVDADAPVEAALRLCKYCVKEIGWTGAWTAFDLAAFMRDHGTFFGNLPRRTDLDAPIDRYVRNWGQISEERRRAKDWTCERCRVRLADRRRLLHVHHVNGVRSDNSAANLRVLCAACHCAEPMHGNMKLSRADLAEIEAARRDQGLRWTDDPPPRVY